VAESTIVAARTRERPRESQVRGAAERGERAAVATDALALCGLFVLVAVAALVTNARLPARELDQVSSPGIDAGIRRGLAFAGFDRPSRPRTS
jgi:hypothetical protein